MRKIYFHWPRLTLSLPRLAAVLAPPDRAYLSLEAHKANSRLTDTSSWWRNDDAFRLDPPEMSTATGTGNERLGGLKSRQEKCVPVAGNATLSSSYDHSLFS